jgi:hypothetical protein
VLVNRGGITVILKQTPFYNLANVAPAMDIDHHFDAECLLIQAIGDVVRLTVSQRFSSDTEVMVEVRGCAIPMSSYEIRGRAARSGVLKATNPTRIEG